MRHNEELAVMVMSMLMEWAFVCVLYFGIAACFGLGFTWKGVVGAWFVRQLLTVKVGVSIGEGDE